MIYSWGLASASADSNLQLLLSSALSLSLLVLIAALTVAAFFLEYIRRVGCSHSIERSAASDSFFEDPSSLNKVPCPSIFDPADKYLSLIIPAYNEEDRLPSTLDETLNYLQQRSAAEKSFSYEVLIVDDGSRDHTSRVAFDYVRKYKIDNVRVLLLGRNHGKGEAIRKGMLHSRGNLLLMLDADGATKLTDLEKLESQIQMFAENVKKAESTPDSCPRLSDIEIAVFGSRAHLEKKALATVVILFLDSLLEYFFRNDISSPQLFGFVLSPEFLIFVHSTRGLTRLIIFDKNEEFKMEIEQKESSSQTRNIETEFLVKNGETKKFSVHVVQNLEVILISFYITAILLFQRKWYRNLMMKGFHLLVLLTAGPGICDTQCGFKMFTRSAARKLFTNMRLKRWCFDVELVYLCKHLRIPMVEVAVNWTEIPGSKADKSVYGPAVKMKPKKDAQQLGK